jgi:hypothetical protein
MKHYHTTPILSLPELFTLHTSKLEDCQSIEMSGLLTILGGSIAMLSVVCEVACYNAENCFSFVFHVPLVHILLSIVP